MRFLANILAKAGLVVDGAVTLNNVAAASTNTDRFLVVDSGVVKYRTGSQLLSDISAVGGSGTINYVSKFTGATTLGNSLIFDNGTNIGINTSSPYSYPNYTFATLNGASGSGFSFRYNNTEAGQIYGQSSGMDFTSASGIRIYTAGSERLTISSTGNVGIGSTSPGAPLHIYSALSETLRLQFNGQAPYMSFWNASARIGYIQYDFLNGVFFINETNTPMAFYTNSIERVRIDTVGRVGIGTNSPGAPLDVQSTSNYILQVKNTSATAAATIYTSNTSGNFFIGNDSANGAAVSGTAYARLLWGQGAYPLVLATNNLERMRITSGGDVTIGSTNVDPFSRNDDRRINIDASDISSTANLALSLNAGATAGRGAQIYMGVGGTRHFTLSSNSTETTLGTATNSPLRLNTNDTTKVYITATGNVGIGTTTPTHLLEVNGTIKFGTRIYFETSAGGFFGSRDEAIGIWMNQAGGNIMQFVTGSNERMRIGASGELLLGSTSSRTANRGYSSGGTSGGAITPLVQIHANAGGSGGPGRFILHNYVNNDIYGPTYVLLKSRGTAIGSNTIVNSGDNIGTLSFQAVDGAQAMEAAYIAANVDGTSALNSIPGRIIFGTTPVGSTAPVERMRIDSTGSVGIGTSAPSASSILELNSTTRGFLPPKMTAAQRAAISSPAVGLVVYQTDSTEGLWIYTSANGWKALAIVT